MQGKFVSPEVVHNTLNTTAGMVRHMMYFRIKIEVDYLMWLTEFGFV